MTETEYNPQDDIQPTEEEWNAFKERSAILGEQPPTYLTSAEIGLWDTATATALSPEPSNATKMMALFIRQSLRQQAAASELAGIYADMIVNFGAGDLNLIDDTKASTRDIVFGIIEKLRSGTVPIGNNKLSPENLTELFYSLKNHRDRLLAACKAVSKAASESKSEELLGEAVTLILDQINTAIGIIPSLTDEQATAF